MYDDRGIVTDVRSHLPAAGWYADPTDPSATRWWDGHTWTAHVAPVPVLPAVGSAAVIPAAAVVPAAVTQSVAEPAPYRPFADRDARYPLAPEAPLAWRRDPTPNPAANRAAIAAALVTVFVVASWALNITVGVPLIAIGFAIVFGIVGIVRSRTTLSGLKRSIAALVVGVVALIITLVTVLGTIALATADYTPDYAADVEVSIVAVYNSAGLGIAAVSAECALVDLPREGDMIPCTLALADGGRREVVLTFTTDDSFVADIPA